MTKEIEAVYEHGVIRPLEPLEMPEGSRLEVTVNIHDVPVSAFERGQREINYLNTVADEKILEALKQVSALVATLARGGQVDLSPLEQAIQQISKATKDIAGPVPPGCEPVVSFEQSCNGSSVAEKLAEIAALPLEGSSDIFSSRDHDSILYPKENDFR